MKPIQTDSHPWKAVDKCIEHRIRKLRGYLESPATSWEDTIKFRAELAGLRHVQGLPKRIDDGTEPSLQPDD